MTKQYAQPPMARRNSEKDNAAAKSVGDDVAEHERDFTQRVDQIAVALVESADTAYKALAVDDDFERNPLTQARFLTPLRRDARRRELLRELTKAGRGLVTVFNALLDERQIWNRLAHQAFDTHELGLREHVLLWEAQEQQLILMLHHLGYGDGPPPAQVWVERIQQPLRTLQLGVDPAQAVVLAAEVEHHLRILVRTLNLLVEMAEQREDPEPRLIPPRTIKARLRTALGALRDHAVPALLIAAGSTSISVAVLGDPAGAAAAGGAELITACLELGAAGWIARSSSPRSAGVQVDLAAGLDTLETALRLAGSSPRDVYGPLLVARAAMQLILDSTRLKDQNAQQKWWDWAERAESLMESPNYDQASAEMLYRSAQELVVKAHP